MRCHRTENTFRKQAALCDITTLTAACAVLAFVCMPGFALCRAAADGGLLDAVPAASSPSSAEGLPDNWIRGTDFFFFHSGDASSAAAIAALSDAVAQLPHLDYAALQWMWHQASATSNNVTDRAGVTPSNEDLAVFIDTAHTMGLKVLLKPIVVAPDGVQMMDLIPSDAAEWFATCTSQMVRLATMANDHGVEMIAVGVELQLIAVNASNLPYWSTLITTLRDTAPTRSSRTAATRWC